MEKTLIFFRIAKMGTTELAKFCHSLPETKLTESSAEVRPNWEFGWSIQKMVYLLYYNVPKMLWIPIYIKYSGEICQIARSET